MSNMSSESDTKCVLLRDCFSEPVLDVMTFLNSVTFEYPQAISFAPGRPLERFFRVEDHLLAVQEFVSVMAERQRTTKERIWQDLGQYSQTGGIINELIAQHLERDEGICVPPEAIITTVGAQEAMAILLLGLFEPSTDLLLVSDPGYIGMTGPARMLGIRTIPVPADDDGLHPDRVEEVVQQCRQLGRPRALYDVPDFNNPLGTVLSRERREAVLNICRKHDMLLVEDNAYAMYRFEGEKIPAIKALDRDGTVLYIGSFSKTLFPGLRLGYLVANQRVQGTGEYLARELSKVKGLLTINSSPVIQAIVGGVLLKHGGSLQPIVRPKVEHLRRSRDEMLDSLSSSFSDMHGRVSWNRPAGGFFITVTLPFAFGKDELVVCARDFGVIVCPMTFFTLGQGRERQIRLSFSYVEDEGAQLGIERLARFVHQRVARD